MSKQILKGKVDITHVIMLESFRVFLKWVFSHLPENGTSSDKWSSLFYFFLCDHSLSSEAAEIAFFYSNLKGRKASLFW